MRLYQIDPRDTVAVALEDIPAGAVEEVGGTCLQVEEFVAGGHKVALQPIRKWETVVKYGCPIGVAKEDIPQGGWVHTHNLLSQADREKKFVYRGPGENPLVVPGVSELTFSGFLRASGQAGTRNYIAILSGGFCANAHMKVVGQMAQRMFPQTENFDGVLVLTHECGCGQEGQDLVNVRKILAGLMQNPNIGAVLFLEVGCENNQLDVILDYAPQADVGRIRRVTMQRQEDEYAAALSAMRELYDMVTRDRRSPCPISLLHVGSKCGGSDGLSGLTANKLVGTCAERVCANGGTFTITEVTEMFGAEQLLLDRAADYETYCKIGELLRRHREYICKYGGSANGNPSYGNKEGGISTIEDKSLGCIQKGGRCAVSDVVFYGDRSTKKGFQLVQGPGSDLVGVTAQIAAGANLLIFTTGRGTPIAFAGPTLKVASNSTIFQKKRQWMDFDAGCLLQGKSLDELGEEFWHVVLDAASGRYRCSNERMGFYEIGILRDGVIL